MCAGMLDKVRQLLTSDPDPMVVSNCMSVIVKVRRCHSLARSASAQSTVCTARYLCELQFLTGLLCSAVGWWRARAAVQVAAVLAAESHQGAPQLSSLLAPASLHHRMQGAPIVQKVALDSNIILKDIAAARTGLFRVGAVPGVGVCQPLPAQHKGGGVRHHECAGRPAVDAQLCCCAGHRQGLP